MIKLNDQEIAKTYIGKPYSIDKLLEVARPNRENEYMACYVDLSKEYLDLFRITPLLDEKWKYYGVDFTVFIDVENEAIKDCRIYKSRDTWGGRSIVLTPTQQEIRIFKRIMDYVTQ